MSHSEHAQAESEAEPVAPQPATEAPPFLVAGIGASAGGFEALTQLIRELSSELNLALVFSLHLARDHESILPMLLAAQTGLKVEAGDDGKRIEPGHLYVLKPNTRMGVLDGRLRVHPRPDGRAPDLPIDYLLSSMALQYGERAVGVLLSGGGRDGTDGVQKIRAAGGITIVQDPGQAQVNSMPRSAIASGAIDLVLPTEQIAEELRRLAEHPFFRQAASPLGLEPEPSAPDAALDLQPLFQVLRRITGVDFARYKLPTLQRRIRRRMALQRVADLPTYLAQLRDDRREVELLHDDILIHVTSFFREPESFEALKSNVLPQLIEQRAEGAPIRAWVPGCSSGEEAYSLAITILEALGERSHSRPVLVFGTDLSHKMIERARSATYPDRIATEVSPERLRRYFVQIEGGYRLNTSVRERCVFSRQDITRDPPFSRLDIVMCRNLLIYLGHQSQTNVITLFHYALSPGGVLVLGRSETIGAQADLFSVVDARWKFYARRPGAASLRDVDFANRADAKQAQGPSELQRRPGGAKQGESQLQAETNRLLLDRYTPPSIVVDQSFRIVRTQGSTAPFIELPSGEASLDVLKMVRPGLMSTLRSALLEARDSARPARKVGLEYFAAGESHSANLEVMRLGEPPAQHFLIVFEDTTPAASAVQERDGAGPPEPPELQPAVRQLQQELTDTRLHLQSMIHELESANEELQSANEEILSSNEELQSTNEELDTAREELQSTNEELGTVNDELQARNQDLSRANSDLLNLLGNIDIPIVMVGADLRVRMFTPAAQRVLNLIAADIGRPIGHVHPNIAYPDLEQSMRQVIDSILPHEREVSDAEGHTYVATIRPYKNVDQRIDGAVLALFDVSSALKTASETGEALMSTVRDPILLLDGAQVVRRANRAFIDKFGVIESQTEGRSVFELGNGQWNIPALRRLLHEILPQRQNFQDFLVEHDFPGIGRKRMLLDGRRIESSRRRSDGVVLLIIRDVTNAQV